MSEFILQIESLLSAFSDPEYLFLAIEPLITYGLLTGVILLVTGFFVKAPRLQVAALIVIGGAAFLHVPYKDARLRAEPRLEQVYKHEIPTRAKGFSATTKAWVSSSWLFRLLVIAAFGTLLIGIHRNRLGFGLAIATVLLGLLAVKNAMWFNYQDALAYHPNLQKHRAPIDQKMLAAPSSQSVSKERLPATAVAQPVAPARQVTSPSSIPVPGTHPTARSSVQRIQAPVPPSQLRERHTRALH